MPRLDPIERNQASPEALPFYDLDEERYGEVLNNTKLYAHNIAVLRAIKGFVGAFAESYTIPLALKAAAVRMHICSIPRTCVQPN